MLVKKRCKIDDEIGPSFLIDFYWFVVVLGSIFGPTWRLNVLKIRLKIRWIFGSLLERLRDAKRVPNAGTFFDSEILPGRAGAVGKGRGRVNPPPGTGRVWLLVNQQCQHLLARGQGPRRISLLVCSGKTPPQNI